MSLAAKVSMHCKAIGVFDDGRLLRLIETSEALDLAQQLRNAVADILAPAIPNLDADAAFSAVEICDRR